MENLLDFGELAHDENLRQRITEFQKDLNSSKEMLNTLFKDYKYEDLTVEDKVRYDLFLAFAINSFFWMYLRTKGIDPSQHEIKSQINRVREYMNKSRQIYEKKTIMPRIDQGAAKRFIKSGLWTPTDTSPETTLNSAEINSNHKRKRQADD